MALGISIIIIIIIYVLWRVSEYVPRDLNALRNRIGRRTIKLHSRAQTVVRMGKIYRYMAIFFIRFIDIFRYTFDNDNIDVSFSQNKMSIYRLLI